MEKYPWQLNGLSDLSSSDDKNSNDVSPFLIF